MGSTFFSLHYHIVFSTKERRPFIKPEWQPRLHAYLGGIIKGMHGVPRLSAELRVMSISWRVRRPVHCIADVLRDLKKESSTWAKENFNRRFTWQEGYAAFTVSPTATDSVRRYIATQEAHHRKHSFVDELRELPNAAGIEFDEKYYCDVWHPFGVRS
jgi:putative transposase